MSSAPTPPPGWYPAAGGWRWWDGRAWGPFAPPTQHQSWPEDPVASGTTLSVLAHVGFFFAAVILALALRLTEGNKNEYIRHHTTEALNFQITMFAVWFGGFAVLMGSTLAIGSGDDGAAPGVFVVVVLAMVGWFFAASAMAIVGAIRASQGRWWRYPISIRFVRGARREPPR